jgi:SH3-like domain-containing protein
MTAARSTHRLFSKTYRAAIVLAVVLAAAASIAAESKRRLPRFVSLRSNEINVRTGPGERYPVQWVLRRRFMPVEIIAEFETWRRIRDWEGAIGWVHQRTLTGRRSIIVTGQIRTLRRKPRSDAPAVARAEPKIVGRLLSCRKSWCRVDIQGHRGWLRRRAFWGAYAKEFIK